MAPAVTLLIRPDGTVLLLYQEHLSLSFLGSQTVRRASHVDPDARGRWWADLRPSGGPVLGPYPNRSRALAAEVRWLSDYLLGGADDRPPVPA